VTVFLCSVECRFSAPANFIAAVGRSLGQRAAALARAERAEMLVANLEANIATKEEVAAVTTREQSRRSVSDVTTLRRAQAA
jgi:hypothetical protein